MGRKRFRRQSRVGPLLAILFITWIAFRLYSVTSQNEQAPFASYENVRVARVVDGDTLLLESGARLRLLGVDTPETKHPDLPPQPFGPEATQFTERFLQGGSARLEFDREQFDNYGRILAFVFVDDRMLNEELVAAGLATAEPQYPYRGDYKRRFLQAEESAKAARLGIWSLHELTGQASTP
ncbi:Thermonuclease precursor [Thalassoglobus neptunius]|uniref:Thermonuclease n=1 Tax=Thalassoglobus neptunius TaxID=1938619 RepID=A0A5C5WYZ6_9PLAN|nr:thermonuclease family protein [Thalassoglobus neptunius]TWT55321.1 Thermonuclease precursor [Thalassoglobus neptunius]